MDGDRPGFDEVVATVVGVGFTLFPTVVGINITGIILLVLLLYNIINKTKADAVIKDNNYANHCSMQWVRNATLFMCASYLQCIVHLLKDTSLLGED